MKLDRNINSDGRGKYALVLNRKLAALPEQKRKEAVALLECLEDLGIIDHGTTPDTEFFPIRLKDKYAGAALASYAQAARVDGQHEWAEQVDDLADRAMTHPNQQIPN